MMQGLLPLEEKFQQLCKSEPAKFPQGNADYWTRYSALVDFLRTDIYPNINAGLACLSKSPGIYTDHGGDHFDEVIRYAGLMVLPSLANPTTPVLDPYEIFLLLAAIRLHDAGNIDGREGHARRAFPILQEAGNAVCSDQFEARLIADIAEAHGGRRADGSKDTIGGLPEQSGMGPANCRSRMVAAIVRFSDEICEHQNRASKHHIRANTLPPGNALYHLYAQGVKRVAPAREDKSLTLHLYFDTKDLLEPFETSSHTEGNPDKRFLIDDAIERIQKLDTERRYCNMYLDPQLQTARVKVKVELVHEQTVSTVSNIKIPKIWKDWKFELQDDGYPDDVTVWRERVSDLVGQSIAGELKAGRANE
jgi:hypothetical protein